MRLTSGPRVVSQHTWDGNRTDEDFFFPPLWNTTRCSESYSKLYQWVTLLYRNVSYKSHQHSYNQITIIWAGGGGLCWCDTCCQVSDRCFLPVSTEQPSTFWSCANETVLSCCLIQVFGATWSLTKPNWVFCSLTSSPEQKHRKYRNVKLTRICLSRWTAVRRGWLPASSYEGRFTPTSQKRILSLAVLLFILPNCFVVSCQVLETLSVEKSAPPACICKLPAYVQVCTCLIDVCTKCTVTLHVYRVTAASALQHL